MTLLSVQAVEAIQRRCTRKYQRAVVLDGPEDCRLGVARGTALEGGVCAQFDGLARGALYEFRGRYSVRLCVEGIRG